MAAGKMITHKRRFEKTNPMYRMRTGKAPEDNAQKVM
jgi:hypothetical protein